MKNCSSPALDMHKQHPLCVNNFIDRWMPNPNISDIALVSFGCSLWSLTLPSSLLSSSLSAYCMILIPPPTFPYLVLINIYWNIHIFLCVYTWPWDKSIYFISKWKYGCYHPVVLMDNLFGYMCMYMYTYIHSYVYIYIHMYVFILAWNASYLANECSIPTQ